MFHDLQEDKITSSGDSFLISKCCKRKEIITKKGSKSTEKCNKRYDNECPDQEISFPIVSVFLNISLLIFTWHSLVFLAFILHRFWGVCHQKYYQRIKSYFHYKTITSQNVPCEAQIFCRKIMFCSQDIQVFVFLTIPWFTKSVKSWWVLVHETRCIFECIFWTTTHEVTNLRQLIDISKGNNFQ